MIKAMAICGAMLAATAAGADPISGREAAKALFAPQGATVIIVKEAGLPAAHANALKTVLSSNPITPPPPFRPMRAC